MGFGLAGMLPEDVPFSNPEWAEQPRGKRNNLRFVSTAFCLNKMISLYFGLDLASTWPLPSGQPTLFTGINGIGFRQCSKAECWQSSGLFSQLPQSIPLCLDIRQDDYSAFRTWSASHSGIFIFRSLDNCRYSLEDILSSHTAQELRA